MKVPPQQRGASSTSTVKRHTDPRQRRLPPRATFVPEAARIRHVGAGFIATVPGSHALRTAHSATGSRLAAHQNRRARPGSIPPSSTAPTTLHRAFPTSPARKKAPAHKAAGANGTTTT